MILCILFLIIALGSKIFFNIFIIVIVIKNKISTSKLEIDISEIIYIKMLYKIYSYMRNISTVSFFNLKKCCI